MPFELDRQAIDDVERGALDSDWEPVKDAARELAFAEDRAVFDGYAAAGIGGIRPGTSNPVADAARRTSRLLRMRWPRRSASCGSPASTAPTRCVLGADAYTAVSGSSDQGYPVIQHLERLVDGGIIWAPGDRGRRSCSPPAAAISSCAIGQDISIGYSSHTAATVELYFQETFTFRLLTTEAAVALAPPAK